MKNTPLCPKCYNQLAEETDPTLSKEYPWVCLECDENFYNMEAKYYDTKTS